MLDPLSKLHPHSWGRAPPQKQKASAANFKETSATKYSLIVGLSCIPVRYPLILVIIPACTIGNSQMIGIYLYFQEEHAYEYIEEWILQHPG